MRGVNKVILVGHLGKDPEVRHVNNDVSVANFTLATTESYKDKNGQRVDQTEWHNIVVWRGLAKTAENYLKKGSLVYLEGKLQTRSWDDKEGNKRYTTEIVADNFIMLDRKSESSDSNYREQRQSAPVNQPAGSQESNEEQYADDLPF